MLGRQLVFNSLAACAFLAGCSSSSSDGGTAHGGAAPGGAANGGTSAGSGGTSTQTSGGSSSAGAAGSAGSGGATAGSGGTGTGLSGAGGAPSGGAPGGVGGQASGGAGAGGSGGSSTGTPGLRIVGRTAPGTAAGSARFSWPGVNINARFMGTQVSMNLNDGTNQNRFTVVIDGGTPKTIKTVSGQTTLPLATGLTNGAHSLVVWRNTEASIGVSELTSLSNFGTGGALLAPATAPDRRIEVIGDSLSVGAGVEGTMNDCSASGGIDAFTNNYLAYGSVAARAVQADVVTIAWSGIGVYRNYSPGSPTMPARYDFSIPNDNTAWDFTKYQPQVVVINLGTNDFSAVDAQGQALPAPGQPYIDAYVAFVKHVRTKYASANFILVDMYGGDRLTAINSVVTALKNGGETKVEEFSVSDVQNSLGCNSHPNIAGQQAMGAKLATRLKALMGW